MAEDLFGGDLSQNGLTTAFRCSLEIDEDKGTVEFISAFSYRMPGDKEDAQFETRHQAAISNPIALAVVVMGVIKGPYGICVAGRSITSTATQIYVSYRQSKIALAKDKKPSLRARTRAFVSALKSNADNIKGGILGAATGCAGVSILTDILT